MRFWLSMALLYPKYRVFLYLEFRTSSQKVTLRRCSIESRVLRVASVAHLSTKRSERVFVHGRLSRVCRAEILVLSEIGSLLATVALSSIILWSVYSKSFHMHAEIPCMQPHCLVSLLPIQCGPPEIDQSCTLPLFTARCTGLQIALSA